MSGDAIDSTTKEELLSASCASSVAACKCRCRRSEELCVHEIDSDQPPLSSSRAEAVQRGRSDSGDTHQAQVSSNHEDASDGR
jgi:hypothetical protein